MGDRTDESAATDRSTASYRDGAAAEREGEYDGTGIPSHHAAAQNGDAAAEEEEEDETQLQLVRQLDRLKLGRTRQEGAPRSRTMSDSDGPDDGGITEDEDEGDDDDDDDDDDDGDDDDGADDERVQLASSAASARAASAAARGQRGARAMGEGGEGKGEGKGARAAVAAEMEGESEWEMRQPELGGPDAAHITDEMLDEWLERVHARWTRPAASQVERFARTVALYGYSAAEPIVGTELQERYAATAMWIMKLAAALLARRMTHSTSDDPVIAERSVKLNQTYEAMHTGMQSLLANAQCWYVTSPGSAAMLPVHLTAERYVPPDVRDWTPTQCLIHATIMRCMRHFYRRIDNVVYQHHVHEGKLIPNCFRPVSSILQAMHKFCEPFALNGQYYNLLMQAGEKNARYAALLMASIEDPRFPVLHWDNTITAYPNGEFLRRECWFYPYDAPELRGKIASHFIPCKFDFPLFLRQEARCVCARRKELREMHDAAEFIASRTPGTSNSGGVMNCERPFFGYEWDLPQRARLGVDPDPRPQAAALRDVPPAPTPTPAPNLGPNPIPNPAANPAPNPIPNPQPLAGAAAGAVAGAAPSAVAAAAAVAVAAPSAGPSPAQTSDSKRAATAPPPPSSSSSSSSSSAGSTAVSSGSSSATSPVVAPMSIRESLRAGAQRIAINNGVGGETKRPATAASDAKVVVGDADDDDVAADEDATAADGAGREPSAWMAAEKKKEKDKSARPMPLPGRQPPRPQPPGDCARCGTDYARVLAETYDVITRTQRFSEGQVRWLYGFGDRMHYEIGERDKWPIIVNCVGVAGSGKSTVIDTQASQHAPASRGYLGEHVEDNFPLMSVYKKRSIWCIEFGARANIKPEMLSRMADGHIVNVFIKGKESVEMKWIAHMMFAYNERPKWPTSGGQMDRRNADFFFLVRPKRDGEDLGRGIANELPAIAWKGCRAYTDLSWRYGGAQDVWKALPAELKTDRQRVESENDCLVLFLRSSRVVLRADAAVSLDEFSREYGVYCHEQQLRNRKPIHDKQYTGPIFARHDIREVDGGMWMDIEQVVQTTGRHLLGVAVVRPAAAGAGASSSSSSSFSSSSAAAAAAPASSNNRYSSSGHRARR